MEKRFFLVFVFLVFACSLLHADMTIKVNPPSSNLPTATTGNLTETVGPGTIDWTEYSITAKGWAVIDSSLPIAQAKAMAQRGAIVVAQRNLLEIIKGVNVYSETKVQDYMTKSDYVYTKVEGVVKNAVSIGNPIEKDGMIEVTLGIKIYDEDGLASVIKKEMPPTNKANMQISKDEKKEFGKLKNLAIDLTGIEYEPGIFPRILDENGNVIFDSKDMDLSKVDYAKVINYVQNPDDLKKDVNENTVFKAVKKVGSDIVVAMKDPKTIDWLKKAFDVIVTAGKAIVFFI